MKAFEELGTYERKVKFPEHSREIANSRQKVRKGGGTGQARARTGKSGFHNCNPSKMERSNHSWKNIEEKENAKVRPTERERKTERELKLTFPECQKVPVPRRRREISERNVVLRDHPSIREGSMSLARPHQDVIKVVYL